MSLLQDQVEKHKQELIDYINEETKHLVYVEDKLVDPTNSEKQLGRPLSSVEFERRLRTVLPSTVTFIDHPTNITKKAVVLVTNGKAETICPYERGYAPEHSIMQLVRKEIPDIDVISRKKSISGYDMPKSEFVPGKGFVFAEGAERPGFKVVKQIGHEITRGWRTVLIRLITSRLLSIHDAERLFSPDNTANWQNHTGKAAAQSWG